jgi:N-acetylmuramoyl-L-alanine amidase
MIQPGGLPDGAGANEPGLAATKLRLLREAVGHNLRKQGRADAPATTGPRPTPVIPIWIASLALVACLVYVSLPAQVLSRVQTASAHAAPAAPAASARSVEPTVDRPAPKRLARAVLPLSVKRIVIDAGHGGAHNGAVSESGVAEKEITLDVSLRLRRLLQDASFDVMMTRDDDASMSLERRVAFANGNRADLFVSIHVNWIPRPEVRPVETYFMGPTDDPAVLKLAGTENRESGYSLSAYRRLLEKVYFDTRREESQALAHRVNAELFRSLRLINPWLEDRGVKMAPFAVLVGTEMPAILVEVSCLSNEDEVKLLTSADYRDEIAAALLRGIRAYARDLGGVGRKEG